MNIQRYEMYNNYYIPIDDGEVVYYEDHEKIVKALKAEIFMLLSQLEHDIDDCK